MAAFRLHRLRPVRFWFDAEAHARVAWANADEQNDDGETAAERELWGQALLKWRHTLGLARQ
eukprot:4654130-Alexandrium_andersonii.AAC.1